MTPVNPITKRYTGNNRLPLYVAVAFFISWIALAVHPVNRWNWFIENILVIMFVILLTITYRHFRFSDISYILIALLLIFHSVGAHYTYGGVPFSVTIPYVLNPDRNNFDRLVHFAWGLLITYPIYEFLLRVGRISIKWIYIFTLSVVIAASSIFELIEMWGSKLMAKELAAAYLGMQGDMWDAHEDIAMALYGSLIALSIILFMHINRQKNNKQCQLR